MGVSNPRAGRELVGRAAGDAVQAAAGAERGGRVAVRAALGRARRARRHAPRRGRRQGRGAVAALLHGGQPARL